MTIIDSHCHLDIAAFDDDRAEVLQRAIAAGVDRLINPGIDLASSQRAHHLAKAHPQVYCAVGFHPYDAPDLDTAALNTLQDLAHHPKTVAIGEIGLDYYRAIAPKDEQHRAFERQLALADALDLPVIIHQREAAADTMHILRDWAQGGHPGLVLHAFSGDVAMVEEAVELGFYMGLGGPVTFKNAADLRDIARHIPLDRLLLETDAPYLSPHPHRGQRNEPARLPLVAQKLADLFEIDEAGLIAHTTRNTETLFRLPPSE